MNFDPMLDNYVIKSLTGIPGIEVTADTVLKIFLQSASAGIPHVQSNGKINPYVF